ncbi:MAG: hypothetical protein ACJA1A_001038 [Saprospiraceae bacterium]|jgi:hypothetical protein|tara:strand:- start:859 stop:1437 length:579 start_codon:yes stop_codon:yes gene_type:complete
MSFIKSSGFKYFKNLIIGVGAAVVMVGALMKITSHPLGNTFITIGLLTEAFLFFMLGILPPEKDYYWDKLYPGLDKYNASISPLTASGAASRNLDADVVENKLGGMLDELQGMSKSLGSLKALQEVDFSKTSEHLKGMNNFYTRMQEAMKYMDASVDDTKAYKDQMAALNKNLSSLNGVYGNVLNAFSVNKG